MIYLTSPLTLPWYKRPFAKVQEEPFTQAGVSFVRLHYPSTRKLQRYLADCGHPYTLVEGETMDSAFVQYLCRNAFWSLVEKLGRRAHNLCVAVIDEDMSHAEDMEKLVRRVRTFTIFTARTGRYRRWADSVLARTGAVITVLTMEDYAEQFGRDSGRTMVYNPAGRDIPASPKQIVLGGGGGIAVLPDKAMGLPVHLAMAAAGEKGMNPEDVPCDGVLVSGKNALDMAAFADAVRRQCVRRKATPAR